MTWHISANLRHPGKPSPPSPQQPLSWLRGSQMKKDLAAQIKCSAVSHTQIPLSPYRLPLLLYPSLHRLSPSLNILKCPPPHFLPASEKWWICNSDWLWRLVKNSLFLSHPPVKRVHFFPLTVTRLPSHPTLFSENPQCKGTFISSPLPLFFNPFLTIYLSVLIHVKKGLIVCVYVSKGEECDLQTE